MSLINMYGPQKFTENPLLAGVKSFTKTVFGTIPGIYNFAAGARNLLYESPKNLITKGKLESDYDSLDALADYRTFENDYTQPWSQ